MDLVFFVGCKEGGVECVMNLPCFGEAELVCNRGENFDDRERSFTFGGELGVCNGSFEVSGFESDFVAFGEGGESSVVA